MTLTVTSARVADYNLHLLRKSMYLELAAMLLSEPCRPKMIMTGLTKVEMSS